MWTNELKDAKTRPTDGLENLLTFATEHKTHTHMNKRYEELEKLVGELMTDLRKFYDDGNKAAGTRARKALLTLKSWAHEVRKEISAQRATASKKSGSGPSEKSSASKASSKPSTGATSKKASSKKK
ncbi:MAG: hypothetical protein ABDH66_07320 [Bacteroidia bacterium]